MSDNPISESRERVLAVAQAEGYSALQVARWRRAGLLCPAITLRLGHGKGTRTVYPAGTEDQLRALCRFRKTERRIPFLAWQLFLAGYAVPMTYVQSILQTVVDQWESGLRLVLDPAGQDLSDAAWDFMDTASRARISRKTFRQARKLVGTVRIDTLVHILLEVAGGVFPGYRDADDQKILEAGLGLARARTDRLTGAGPWLGDDSGQTLVSLSETLGRYPFSTALSGMSDDDVRRIRDEGALFFSAMATFIPFVEELLAAAHLGYIWSGYFLVRRDHGGRLYS